MKRHLSPIPNPSSSKTPRTQERTAPSIGPFPESGMEELLVCQPVVSTLLSLLPLTDWIKLRRVSRCWRNAVDGQLKSLKELNVIDIFGPGDQEKKIGKDEKKKVVSLLGFFSTKAPAIESLMVGRWLAVSPAKMMNRFRKLKRLDIEDANCLNHKILTVLEDLTGLESLEAISFPPEPRFDFREGPAGFQPSFKGRLELVIGRLESLQSLTLAPFKKHPNVLKDVRNPPKLTQLFMKSICTLPLLQSLPRFTNLRHLKIHNSDTSQAHLAALESALEQLKGLRYLDLGYCLLSPASIQRAIELPHLEHLVTMSDCLPKGVHWAHFRQLSCLELGRVKETFIGYINQITTLQCLKLGARGRVKFTCSLPQLHSLCLSQGNVFQLDFQPASCNIKNLTLLTRHGKLLRMTQGLLKQNAIVRKLRIGWHGDGSKALLAKAKSIAKACKSLETLELPFLHSTEAVSQVASLFLDVCPLLNNLKTLGNNVQTLKEMDKFRHLNISSCSIHYDCWLFQ